jgi:predicted RNase H-like HicB family nuclease
MSNPTLRVGDTFNFHDQTNTVRRFELSELHDKDVRIRIIDGWMTMATFDKGDIYIIAAPLDERLEVTVRCEDGVYVASNYALRVSAQGDTEDEARANYSTALDALLDEIGRTTKEAK